MTLLADSARLEALSSLGSWKRWLCLLWSRLSVFPLTIPPELSVCSCAGQVGWDVCAPSGVERCPRQV